MCEYKLITQVTQSQVDLNNRIKLKKLIDILQDIEALHISNLSIFNNYLTTNNIGIFLTYREVCFLKPIIENDQLNVVTYPTKTTRSGGYRRTIITDQDNNALINSYSFGPFVSLKTNTLVRLPINIIDSFSDKEESDKTPNNRKVDISHLEFAYCYDTPILKTHIDKYKHVNNAIYIQLIEHLIDDDYDYHTLRAEYVTSLSTNNQSFYIYKSINHQNDLSFVIKNQDDQICFKVMLLK